MVLILEKVLNAGLGKPTNRRALLVRNYSVAQTVNTADEALYKDKTYLVPNKRSPASPSPGRI